MAKTKAVATGIRALLSSPPSEEGEDKNDTTPTPQPARPTRGRGHKSPNPRTMVGAGVTLAEKTELQQIATTEGVALNSILAFFIRDAMTRYKAGKLKIPRKTINVIDMPK